MFQLVLSDKLRAELAEVAKQGGESTAQPMVFDANTMRMANMPKYSRSAHADNVALFHGREVRQVPDAAGGMNFVLHLSSSVGDDPEGWTKEELSEYNGWAHDSSRRWRKGELLESEGFSGFRSKFGPEAYTLHHRFYWHLDGMNRFWLSAEDGCEGVVAR